MNYVYIGNIPDNINKGKNTYCPHDNILCIERKGYSIRNIGMDKEGNCRSCGMKIPGVWDSL
jgi:pyruvate formate lyase activating enzyme